MKIGFNMLLWTTNLVEEEFHLLETTAAMDGGTGDFERFHLELEESDGLLVDNFIPLH